MITWVIDETFGGLTTACLQRASSFAAAHGRSHVVTFAFTPKLATTTARLRESGLLSKDVEVCNLYWDYATRVSHPPHRKLVTNTEELSWNQTPTSSVVGDTGITMETYGSTTDETSARKVYRRPDGTVFLVDTKFTRDDKDKREILLYNSDKELLHKFSSASALYRHWLSELVGYQEALMIFDSSFVADMMAPWSAPNATKVFMFHSSHIATGQSPATGALTKKHAKIIENRESWDGFVFLTEQQAQDFVDRFGFAERTAIIPNILKKNSTKRLPRSNRPKRLIAVGSLDNRKQVDHAIRVVHELRERGVNCTLSIVGRGPNLRELEALVADLKLEDLVAFEGHVTDVPNRLANSGILLFTSRLEGQGLVLLEAQFHGCVPISYDVHYGPASVIKTGHTGLLVKPHNIHGMANAVLKLVENPRVFASMSRHARRDARRYNRMNVVKKWEIVEKKFRSRKTEDQ